MMMMAKKKGFQKLSSDEPGGVLRGESDSEVEMDSVTTPSRFGSGWCFSACVLSYLVLLTCIVALLAIFLMYVALNTNALYESHSELQLNIDELKKELQDSKLECLGRYRDLEGRLEGQVNSSRQLNASMTQYHSEFSTSLDRLSLKVKELESTPQKMLLEEVYKIHSEMGVLNGSMRLLAGSLGELQALRQRMAELGSVVDSYDSKLAEFQQSFGDLQAWDSVVKERVNGLEQSLNNLKEQVSKEVDAASKSNEETKHSLDDLYSQMQDLEGNFTKLNQTWWHELEEAISKVVGEANLPANSAVPIPTPACTTPVPSQLPLPSSDVPYGHPSSSAQADQTLPPSSLETKPPATPLSTQLPLPTTTTTTTTNPGISSSDHLSRNESDQLQPGEPDKNTTASHNLNATVNELQAEELNAMLQTVKDILDQNGGDPLSLEKFIELFSHSSEQIFYLLDSDGNGFITTEEVSRQLNEQTLEDYE